MIDVREVVEKDLDGRPRRESKPSCREGDISKEELDTAIKRLKRDKAPGPDNITTDWLKDLDEDNKASSLEM